MFTTPTGGRIHPADVTDHFHHLATQAGLPPIRLHDLRHSAATVGLAAGVQMKVISNRLRHPSPHFTAKFYGDVLPELSQPPPKQPPPSCLVDVAPQDRRSPSACARTWTIRRDSHGRQDR